MKVKEFLNALVAAKAEDDDDLVIIPDRYNAVLYGVGVDPKGHRATGKNGGTTFVVVPPLQS